MPSKPNRFTKEELDKIVFDYKNGMCPKDLEKKYNRRDCIIIAKLKSIGIFVSKNTRWKKEEIEVLKSNYSTANWDFLLKALSNHKKNDIIHKAYKLKIYKDDYYWNENDIKILTNAYENKISIKDIIELLNNKFSDTAIYAKANKLGLKNKFSWSEDEIKLLCEYYPNNSVDDILYLFPNREKHSIIRMAHKNNLISNRLWTDEEKQFIIEHWENKTDYDISIILNRDQRSVKYQRQRLNLFRVVETCSYNGLGEYIRKQINVWRKNSIENCHSKCVITNLDYSDVHHLYGFNLIMNETLDELRMCLKDNFEDYTQEELGLITLKFIEIQNRYPLGVCLTKPIHKLFHNLYGYGNNTQEQFEEFTKNYKNGIYKNLIEQVA